MVNQTDRPKTKKTPAKGSGARRLPAQLPTAGKPKATEIDENRMYALVRAVVEADSLNLDPEWVLEADAAERKGYVTRLRLQLFPTELGRNFVREIDEPEAMRDRDRRTMIKCTEHTRYLLKSMAKEQGVLMFDALAAVIEALYKNRDDLTRAARAAGREYPWEAFDLVGKRK